MLRFVCTDRICAKKSKCVQRNQKVNTDQKLGLSKIQIVLKFYCADKFKHVWDSHYDFA
jgi:hypothetical protein